MIFTLLKISFRNIIRRKLQTFLLGFMIFFTTFMLFAMVGMQTGAFKLIEDSYTQVFNGDIQIRNPEYKGVEDFEKLIDTDSLEKIYSVLDNYKKTDIYYSERFLHFALADINDKNYSFQLVGVNPNQDKNISIVFSSIKKGQYLEDTSYNEIIIGQDLADFFKAKVGDEMVIMTTDIYDSFVIDSFVVKGIYKSGDMSLDKSTAFINKLYFEDNIVYDSNKKTNITIKLKDSSLRGDLLKSLRKEATQNITVLSWDEILPEIKQTIQFQFTVSMMFYLLLVIIVSFTLINSMMLATVKRLPEFGVYSSLGLDNKNFKWILFFENFLLCTVAIGLASVAGMIFLSYFAEHGVPLPDAGSAEDRPLTLLKEAIYPNTSDPLLLVGPILVYISCLLSVVPPLLRLKKSNPIKSITSN